jgi:hypothetical protein
MELARGSTGANIGATTIVWCLINAGQPVASTKRYTETPGGAGQSTRAHTRRRRVTKTLEAATQEFKARYEEMKPKGVRPFG